MTYATEELRDVHRKAVESTAADVAAFLQEVLGQKLVAYIAGVTDPKTVGRWAADESSPRETSEQRLRETYYIFRRLSEDESSHTIRAWFAGMNPLLNEQSPATAIREGRAADTLDAAKAFIADG